MSFSPPLHIADGMKQIQSTKMKYLYYVSQFQPIRIEYWIHQSNLFHLLTLIKIGKQFAILSK